MIELSTLLWSIGISLVIGGWGGYVIKDQFMEADNEVNVDLTVKKNRLFNRKEKNK